MLSACRGSVIGGWPPLCALCREGRKLRLWHAAMKRVVETKEITSQSEDTGSMENKENGSVDSKNSVENGRPPDPAHWAVDDVVSYFTANGFEEQASVFKDQEIDGKSLLLMTRNDVLTGLSLKLGPALKIYEYHVKPLQMQQMKNTPP